MRTGDGCRVRTVRWNTLVACLWGLAVACAGLGVRAEGPAVSRLNGKFDFTTGRFDSEPARIGLGAVSAPLSEHLGLQIDGAYGNVSADDYEGVGGHLFWRDPDKALIGVIASYQELETIALIRYGAEYECYRVEDFIFRVRAGYQCGDVDHGGFVSGAVQWFPKDDVMLESITEYATGDLLQRVGVEFQPRIAQLPGLSFYAEGAVGENRYDRWLVGIRYYFGGPRRSLRDRSRYDDPDILLPDGMNLLGPTLKQDRAGGTGGGMGGGGYPGGGGGYPYPN